MEYLEDNRASLKQIEEAIVELLQGPHSHIPTQDNIRAKLKDPPSSRIFRFALKITALLRSKVIVLASRRLVLMDGVVE
jgi:hypothetical protein